MSSGTSRTIESTLLSAKSSCPVQANPCRAPSTSAKNGSLRSPAASRIPFASTGWAVPSKLTGKPSARTSPPGSAWGGPGGGGCPGGPGLPAVLVLGEDEGERDVGVVVAVGVDVDPVDRAGVELRAGDRGRDRRRGAGRVRVDDQHGRARVVAVQQAAV